MRYDLREPCTNCPFRTDETAIRFRTRERAEEIEEQAYRYGFPCHVSAVCEEDPYTGEEGYVAGPNTQLCAGYSLMQLRESGGTPWPAIGNDDDVADRLAAQLNWNAPVFECVDDFLAANDNEDERNEKRGRS